MKKALDLPLSAKVGRHEYFFVWHDEAFKPQNGDDVVLMGECRFAETELHFALDQSNSMLRDTIFHECMHAIGYEIGALAWQDLVRKNFNLEEHMVSMYTPALLRFYADNRELMEWLLS